jgi:DNA-binding NarL/FixJ family response regulator
LRARRSRSGNVGAGVIKMQEASSSESEQSSTYGEVGATEASSAPSETTPLGQTRVLVVEERPLVRIGVAGLLRAAGIDVVGEVPGPQAARTAARDVHPNVILMSLHVSGMASAEAVRLVVSGSLGARVVVLARPADGQLLCALAAGACGALVDDAPAHEIVAGVRAAAEGDSVFSPSIARRLMRQLRLLGDVPVPLLTARELEVLELLARGWDNARIAAALYLSLGTGKHHISSILTKLEVDNRIQAAVRAVQLGLIGR